MKGYTVFMGWKRKTQYSKNVNSSNWSIYLIQFLSKSQQGSAFSHEQEESHPCTPCFTGPYQYSYSYASPHKTRGYGWSPCLLLWTTPNMWATYTNSLESTCIYLVVGSNFPSADHTPWVGVMAKDLLFVSSVDRAWTCKLGVHIINERLFRMQGRVEVGRKWFVCWWGGGTECILPV